jgi:hypothetical protein
MAVSRRVVLTMPIMVLFPRPLAAALVVFTEPGTYTKPAGLRFLEVEVIPLKE